MSKIILKYRKRIVSYVNVGKNKTGYTILECQSTCKKCKNEFHFKMGLDPKEKELILDTGDKKDELNIVKWSPEICTSCEKVTKARKEFGEEEAAEVKKADDLDKSLEAIDRDALKKHIKFASGVKRKVLKAKLLELKRLSYDDK